MRLVFCVEGASGGQAWDPFRPPLLQQPPRSVCRDRPVAYAKKTPNQLVRAAHTALLTPEPSSAQAQAASRSAWSQEVTQLGHASVGQAQPAQAPPPAQQYARTRQTQLVLKPPQQHIPGHAPPFCTAQPNGRSAAAPACAAQAGPLSCSKGAQGIPLLARRPRYAKNRPNQLQRLPSLSPAVRQGQQGRAASAQDTPAARLRALLAARLPPSQHGPQRRSSLLARRSSTSVRARLGQASKVYVRQAASSAEPGSSSSLAAASRSTGTHRSRFVFVRSSLQAASQGIRRAAPHVLQRPRLAGVAKQRGGHAAGGLRTHGERQRAAGKAGAAAPRRPAQLRRLGSQMYSVVSSRALRRQATPMKPAARRNSPGSQLKRARSRTSF